MITFHKKNCLTMGLLMKAMTVLDLLLRNCNIDVLKDSHLNSFLLSCGRLPPSFHHCLFSLAICGIELFQVLVCIQIIKKYHLTETNLLFFLFFFECVCCAFKYTLFLSWIPLCGGLGNWSRAPKRTRSITS